MVLPAVRRLALLLLLAATAAAPAGCGVGLPVRDGDGSPGPAPEPAGREGAGAPRAATPSGGVLVTLEDRGERFRIWVTEPTAAQQMVDVGAGRLAFVNVTGRLRAGPGEAAHNAPWSWHLDPASILVNIHTFAPVYAERPSVVEADLVALLAAGSDKMTGPPGGTVVAVQDLRVP